MSGWLDTDLAGLRSNSSLAKVIAEMVQNALDTDATEITDTFGSSPGAKIVLDF